MGGLHGRHEIGDIVTPNAREDGRLTKDHEYKITSINRGIDGAYDYDDIYLDGVSGHFCEFFLDTVMRIIK